MNKKEIKNGLDLIGITNYKINEDLTVDVNTGVYIDNKNLSEIPVKFGIINGNFNCSFNNLISLKGSPEIVGRSFDCSYNKLISLEYAPEIINRDF